MHKKILEISFSKRFAMAALVTVGFFTPSSTYALKICNPSDNFEDGNYTVALRRSPLIRNDDGKETAYTASCSHSAQELFVDTQATAYSTIMDLLQPNSPSNEGWYISLRTPKNTQFHSPVMPLLMIYSLLLDQVTLTVTGGNLTPQLPSQHTRSPFEFLTLQDAV